MSIRHFLKILFVLCLSQAPATAQNSNFPNRIAHYKAKSYGVPACPYPVENIQPDGSRITCHFKGDGAVHWLETDDGYSVIKNSGGYFEYAKTSPQGELVPSGVKASPRNVNRQQAEVDFMVTGKKGVLYSPSKIKAMRAQFLQSPAVSLAFPSKTIANLLLLLVEFPDAAHRYTSTQFDNMMNQDNYNGTGSFKQYFYESSYGQLTLNTTISGWYMAPHNHDYYGSTADPDDSRARQLVRDIVDLAAKAGVDFSKYDNDKDGIVDGVMVIHQGLGGENQGFEATCIWSHSSTLGQIAVSYNGVQINDYTINPETQYGGAMNGIGTACHEFNHNLGLPDFYDTDYGASGGQSEDLGMWDVMALGPYNNSTFSPPLDNVYSKSILGWLAPSELTVNAAVSVTNVEQNKSGYFYTTTTANEYFILENRQQIGLFDKYIPGHGMLIYHVDQNYIDANQYCINCDPKHQGFDLEEAVPIASEDQHSASDAFPGTGNRTAFTDNTTPNSKSWAGALTQKSITGIAEAAQIITFNFAPASSISRQVMFLHRLSNKTN